MKLILTVVFLFAFATFSFAQDVSREQKFQRIKELNAQINELAQELLQPEQTDVKNADIEALKVFRLMPRETFSRPIAVPQGGGSYYSFTTGSNDYQKIAQIGLEQNSLKTGFAGADHGFMADLGEIPLSKVTSETAELAFLLKYRAATNIVEARVEQRKAGNHKVDGLHFKNYLPAVLGHTYVLRNINYGNADIVVAFKIERKDTDGSLIIFWKQMGDFGKPTLDPNIKEN